MKKVTGRLPRVRSYGPVEFWYDQHHRLNAIVVECDDPNAPVIRAYPFKDNADRERRMKTAQRLLRAIRTGRVDYRKLAQRVPETFRWTRDYGSLFESRPS